MLGTPESSSSSERKASTTMMGSKIRPVHISRRRSLLSSFICILVSQVGPPFPENRRRSPPDGHTTPLQIFASTLTMPDTAACVCLTCAGIPWEYGHDPAATLHPLQEMKWRPNMPSGCPRATGRAVLTPGPPPATRANLLQTEKTAEFRGKVPL